jgi:hypothetical protein
MVRQEIRDVDGPVSAVPFRASAMDGVTADRVVDDVFILFMNR